MVCSSIKMFTGCPPTAVWLALDRLTGCQEGGESSHALSQGSLKAQVTIGTKASGQGVHVCRTLVVNRGADLGFCDARMMGLVSTVGAWTLSRSGSQRLVSVTRH